MQHKRPMPSTIETRTTKVTGEVRVSSGQMCRDLLTFKSNCTCFNISSALIRSQPVRRTNSANARDSFSPNTATLLLIICKMMSNQFNHNITLTHSRINRHTYVEIIPNDSTVDRTNHTLSSTALPSPVPAQPTRPTPSLRFVCESLLHAAHRQASIR